MTRSMDCMLRLESLEWHAGTPVTTIGCAIQAGELPATGRPRRVRASDFEDWLVHQSMDGGKRHKRRGELDRWRQHYPDGEPAPFESYPVAEAPAEAEQARTEPELPLANGHDYRDMLVRTIGFFLEGYGERAGIPADVRAWWEDGPLQEYEQAWRRRKALEDLERARRKLHEAEAEVLRLEAA